jgi:hypothetical protein|nr:MAG TPA: hypothetical protein [Caudoviricetes sp.]
MDGKLKISLGVAFLAVVISVSCAKSRENADLKNRKFNFQTSETTETTTNFPVEISYSEIKQNIGKSIKIEGTVTSIDTMPLILEVWFKVDGKYTEHRLLTIEERVIGSEMYEYLRNNLKIGDNCIFTTEVFSDGSIGGPGITNVEVVGNTPVEEVMNSYADNCTEIAGVELARAPEKYKGADITINGRVLQVVNDSGSMVDFLLDTGEDNGTIYISYSLPDAVRILENDRVTVYGQYIKLTTYRTLAGTQRTIPVVSAEYVKIK